MKPRRRSIAPPPIAPGVFSVRRFDGVWLGTALHEARAWETFLTECRTGRFVQLLRGTVVVASLRAASKDQPS